MSALDTALREHTGLRLTTKDLEDPEKRQIAEELLAAIEANPLENYNNALLNPGKVHKKQLEFHAIKCPPMGVKGLIAANRSGKTIACRVDDIIQLLDRDLVPEHLQDFKKWEPPITIWVGAPKYAKHEDTIIPMFRKFLPKAALIEGSFAKSYKGQHRKLELANGSAVFFKTYDQDLDAWASAEVHRISWDEEPNTPHSYELRSEARARLISTGGEEVIGMTPLLGLSWVHEEIWERRNEDHVAVVQMSMDDNPWNSKQAIQDFAANLTEEEKRMRLQGEFVSLGGLFFEEFRDELHVVDEIAPDHIKGQEIVIGIDPGRERTGVVWVAFDSDNSALVFDEFNPTEMVVPEVAAEIKRRNKFWGIRDAVYVIDPSSRNTSAINADNVEAAYAREEIYVEHGQNSRSAGILEMKRRLQNQTGEKPDPTLLWTRKCPATIEQVRRYAKDPKAKDEWAAIPQTSRVRFDCVDATRYAVMSRTWEFAEDDDYKPPAFQQNFELPFNAQQFQTEPAPMGDWS